MEPAVTRPLVIEMVGPPGTGKSTVSKLLLEALQSRGYHAEDVRELSERMVKEGATPLASHPLFRALPAFLRTQLLRRQRDWVLYTRVAQFARRYRSFVQLMESQIRNGDAEIDRWAFNLLKVYGGRHLRTSQASESDFLLADEGFLQRALSSLSLKALEQPLRLSIVEDFLDVMPAVDGYVIVSSPAVELSRRMQLREKGVAHRLEKLSSEQRQQVAHNFTEVMEAAVQLLNERGSLVFVVENANGENELAKQVSVIAEKLASLSVRPV